MEKKEFSQMEIEEFKYVCDRKKEHENRYSQHLIFCVSSFVTILGFSKIIDPPLIPYMMMCILLPSGRFILGLRGFQNFNSAYMTMRYFENDGISYEAIYNLYSKRNLNHKQNSIKGLMSLRFLGGPLVLFYLISLFSCFYFGISVWLSKIHFFNKIIYYLGLAILHFLFIRIYLENRKYSFFYYSEFMKKTIKK